MTRLAGQSRMPDLIVISAPSEQDVPTRLTEEARSLGLTVSVLIGAVGLTAQRNVALDALFSDPAEGPGAVVFIDDDCLLADDWIETAAHILDGDPALMGLTGALLADGAQSCGYSVEAAEEILLRNAHQLSPSDWRRSAGEVRSLYGCNMIIRGGLLRSLRFDEELPLYGWLEDLDISALVRRSGSIARSNALRAVHMGEKKGRVAGLKLGYSQVANNAYLVRKGTLSAKFGLKLAVNCVASNLLRWARPEPFIDRRGRLRGNIIALSDALRGRLHPKRVLDL